MGKAGPKPKRCTPCKHVKKACFRCEKSFCSRDFSGSTNICKNCINEYNTQWKRHDILLGRQTIDWNKQTLEMLKTCYGHFYEYTRLKKELNKKISASMLRSKAKELGYLK